MTEQNLGLRSSLQIVRRHKIVVGVTLLLGLIAGGAYSVAKPPTLTSTALVVLPYSVHSTATQVVIADSDPVLVGAARRIGSVFPGQALQGRVHVNSLTANVLSITAQGTSARQAELTANAVATSYIAYVSAANAPTGQVQAHILERATTATGATLPTRVALTALLGALAGALVGAVIALAISRGDRRLRDRDDIADAIGVSVLASLQVGRPSDPGGWVGCSRTISRARLRHCGCEVRWTNWARGPRGTIRSVGGCALAIARPGSARDRPSDCCLRSKPGHSHGSGLRPAAGPERRSHPSGCVCCPGKAFEATRESVCGSER